MPGRFRGPLVVRFDAVEAGTITSMEQIEWVVDYGDPHSEVVIVPRQTVTDGASIPSWLWWIVGHPFSRPRSAQVHDLGYRYPELRELYQHGSSRRWWDVQYRRALVVEGASRLNAWVQYVGVRVGGRFHPNWR